MLAIILYVVCPKFSWQCKLFVDRKDCLLIGNVRQGVPHRQPGRRHPGQTTGMQAIQEEMADPGDIRAVLHVELDAVDPVQHHQQHSDHVLWCGLQFYQLDQHDLHDHVHPAHLPGLLVVGQDRPAGLRCDRCPGHCRGQLDQSRFSQSGPVRVGVCGPDGGGSVASFRAQRTCQAGGCLVWA